MSDAAKSPMTPVIVNKRCIGHVLARGKAGFEAFDINDKSVGLFADERAAIAALLNSGGRA